MVENRLCRFQIHRVKPGRGISMSTLPQAVAPAVGLEPTWFLGALQYLDYDVRVRG